MQNAEVIPRDHNRNTFSTAIKISDTAEKYTSQYTVGRENLQVLAPARLLSESLVKKEDNTPPPKNPTIKMMIPTEHPVIIAGKNPSMPGFSFPAPIFSATNADTPA